MTSDITALMWSICPTNLEFFVTVYLTLGSNHRVHHLQVKGEWQLSLYIMLIGVEPLKVQLHPHFHSLTAYSTSFFQI